MIPPLRRSPRILRQFNVASLAVLLTASLGAADAQVKQIEKAPPESLDASIRSLLQPRAVQLIEDGQPALEFWFRQEIPLKGNPESPARALASIPPVALVGAINVLKDRRDYRDNELHAGVYTMRFGLQPEDGNHLGTADYPYFVVLIPAKSDLKPDGIANAKALNKASSKDTAAGHPLIISLRPPAGSGETPRLNEPAPEHKSIVLKLPARIESGGQIIELVFEIVYHGMGKA